MKKTILIIHIKNSSRKPHFEEAKKYGANLILMMENPTWELDYVDSFYRANTANISESLKVVKEILKTTKIDGVVTFVEHAVPTAAFVANALNLTFISPLSATKARNKYEMQRSYEKSGILCPKYSLAADLVQADIFVKQTGFPIIIKPIIGGGSLAVKKILNQKELVENFNKLQHEIKDIFHNDALYEDCLSQYGNSVLLEEYIDGKEISVESLTSENKTKVIAIHDKQMPENSVYFPEVLFSTPSQFSEDMQNKIVQTTKQANVSLGIECGATHTEYRITKDGKLYIIETGARIGGGPIFLSVLHSTGINMIHKIMDIALGKKLTFTKKTQRPVSFFQYFIDKDGVITDLCEQGLEKIRNNPNLIELSVYRKQGDQIESKRRTLAHAHIIASGKSIKKAIINVQNMAENLNFKVVEQGDEKL